ncbi:MAG: hypothetical protein EPO07_18450 [Verrucomicrobia bacterium]|nr:MAG: hypothetical protein EPO07_18450 [Verrucomicrobiota bacterium]
MPTLLDTLAAELERPRPVTPQVRNHLIETHDVARDAIGAFLEQELSRLEDFEVDLILAPIFTPTLHDQSVFANLLADRAVPATEWPALIQQLLARPTRARLTTENQQTHSVQLREVTIERYVHRLRLDGTITPPIQSLLASLPTDQDRALLQAVARRAVWASPARGEILATFFLSLRNDSSLRVCDAVALVKLVETYQPANRAELLAQIPHWLQVLRQEVNEATGAKPFFNERVEELHGGGRDHRRPDDARLKSKEGERAFLAKLQTILAG